MMSFAKEENLTVVSCLGLVNGLTKRKKYYQDGTGGTLTKLANLVLPQMNDMYMIPSSRSFASVDAIVIEHFSSSEFNLYFVVPKDIFNAFKYQKLEQSLRVVKQFVLCIDDFNTCQF